MKETKTDMVVYPEIPPWTMFFDGPLYQKYDEFMRTKDFTTILLTSKLKLASLEVPNIEDLSSQKVRLEEQWWDKEEHNNQLSDNYPPSESYQTASDDVHRQYKREVKRRTRRTRAFVILGFAILGALAIGTALVIHYLVIPHSIDPKLYVNISFTGNSSILEENLSENITNVPILRTPTRRNLTMAIKRPSKTKQTASTIPAEMKHLQNILTTISSSNNQSPIKREKIFPKTFKTSPDVRSRNTTALSIRKSTQANLITTTTMYQTPTDDMLYELHLQPAKASSIKPNYPFDNVAVKSHSVLEQTYAPPEIIFTVPIIMPNIDITPLPTTTQIDPLDFFAMDEILTTTTEQDSAVDQTREHGQTNLGTLHQLHLLKNIETTARQDTKRTVNETSDITNILSSDLKLQEINATRFENIVPTVFSKLSTNMDITSDISFMATKNMDTTILITSEMLISNNVNPISSTATALSISESANQIQITTSTNETGMPYLTTFIPDQYSKSDTSV